MHPNDINPTSPVWPDVIRAVNVLELVAVSWEGELIDENIIRRIFAQRFIHLYRNIEECKNPPSEVGIDGKQMLFECRAATQLYQQLSNEYINQDKLTPISKKG